MIGGTTFNRWEWYNVGRARLQGVELTADWDATPDLTLRASYSFTDSEQRTGDFAGLPWQATTHEYHPSCFADSARRTRRPGP